jgi:hypothetical protein
LIQPLQNSLLYMTLTILSYNSISYRKPSMTLMVAYSSVQNQYPISRGTKLDYYTGDNLAMITGSTSLQLSSDTLISSDIQIGKL